MEDEKDEDNGEEGGRERKIIGDEEIKFKKKGKRKKEKIRKIESQR